MLWLSVFIFVSMLDLFYESIKKNALSQLSLQVNPSLLSPRHFLVLLSGPESTKEMLPTNPPMLRIAVIEKERSFLNDMTKFQHAKTSMRWGKVGGTFGGDGALWNGRK